MRLLIRLVIPAIIAVAVLAVPPVYGALTAQSRISPALQRELQTSAPVYSVDVRLGFKPGYFQTQQLQNIGTVAGATGHDIHVLQLTADQVRQIARFYWVQKVEPLY